ncbi:hypothetical protein J3F83DRAFT_772726 [Trichoderma novae-zelandiae]
MSSQRELRDNHDNDEAQKNAWWNAVLGAPGTAAQPQLLEQQAVIGSPDGISVEEEIWTSEIQQLIAMERRVAPPAASQDVAVVATAAFKHNLEELRQNLPHAGWAEQLVSLASNPTFKRWHKESESQFLVVRHEASLTSNETHSPLSYAYHVLSDKEQQGESIQVINFSCGQHLNESGLRDDYQVIMREITLQLLEYCGSARIGWPDIGLVTFRELLEQKYPRAILLALRIIVSNAGHSTMYVFIDGLHHYQGKPYEEEAKETIQVLNHLVNDLVTPRIPRLKVLITNPTREQQQSWGFEVEAATIEL